MKTLSVIIPIYNTPEEYFQGALLPYSVHMHMKLKSLLLMMVQSRSSALKSKS